MADPDKIYESVGEYDAGGDEKTAETDELLSGMGGRKRASEKQKEGGSYREGRWDLSFNKNPARKKTIENKEIRKCSKR